MKKLLFILLLGLGFSQTELTTRVYNIEFNELNQDYPVDIFEITGYDLDKAIIGFVSASDYTQRGLDFWCHNVRSMSLYDANAYGQSNLHYLGFVSYEANNNCHFEPKSGPYTNTLTISVTAEFPIEDTGYIEEGFEFCLQPGANLVSYPCDNPVPVGQALPNGIENFVTAIIGQGVATEYNSALGWIGSLDSFNEGGGYWFKSNSAVCFQYDCVEN